MTRERRNRYRLAGWLQAVVVQQPLAEMAATAQTQSYNPGLGCSMGNKADLARCTPQRAASPSCYKAVCSLLTMHDTELLRRAQANTLLWMSCSHGLQLSHQLRSIKRWRPRLCTFQQHGPKSAMCLGCCLVMLALFMSLRCAGLHCQRQRALPAGGTGQPAAAATAQAVCCARGTTTCPY